jgi:1-acyl-sn-glycerol-3-phosphate acyltransferase
MIRTTLAYLFAGLYILIVSPIAMALAWLTGDTVVIYRLARFCIRSAGCIAGVRVTILGAEKIPAEGPCYFLSNHLSNCDVPALAHALPRDFRALTKKEVMRLPVLSMILRRVSFVPVDRRDPNQARAAIDRGAALLRQGLSFLAFPEGTRSRDGQLGEFKRGVFVMAIKGQTPVVPVTVLNSAIIQPRGSYRIRPGTIEVIFHDPIPTAGLSIADRDRLIELTREAIVRQNP